MGKKKRVRMQQFTAQVGDAIGLDDGNFLEIELDIDRQTVVAYLYLPVIDQDRMDVLAQEIMAAPSERDRALLMLSGRDDVSAEEQLALFERATRHDGGVGWRPNEITTLWAVQARLAREELERVGKARLPR